MNGSLGVLRAKPPPVFGFIRLSRRLLGSREIPDSALLIGLLDPHWGQCSVTGGSSFWHLSSSCNLQGSSCFHFLMGDSCCVLGLSSWSSCYQGQEFFTEWWTEQWSQGKKSSLPLFELSFIVSCCRVFIVLQTLVTVFHVQFYYFMTSQSLL